MVYIRVSSQEEKGGERILAVIALGVLEALRADAMSFKEAEHSIFGPWPLQIARQLDLHPDLVDVLHSGLFLEDYEDLFPNPETQKARYYAMVDRLKTKLLVFLQENQATEHPDEYWIESP